MDNKSEIKELSRQAVRSDYESAKAKNREEFLKGNKCVSSEYIFPNQIADAKKVTDEFYNNKRVVISIVKRTKVGMDGLMIEILKNETTHPDDNYVIHRNNVFVITGMSNISWESEFKKKAPTCFVENVHHHGKLDNLVKKLKNINNALIIIDEIDTGTKEGQKMDKMLIKCGIKDIDYLKTHNIRLVMVSATNKNELKELYKWGNQHKVINMTIPDTYISHGDFLTRGIIQEWYPIKTEKAAEKWIKEDILENYKNDYRVHFIRLLSETDIKNVEKMCAKYNIECKKHNSIDRIENPMFDEIFRDIKQHTVIILKNLMRRATEIYNHWKIKIGAVHEYFSENPDTNVQIQGLSGRMTGYWKKIIDDHHKTGPYRTSIKTVEAYEKFFADTENPDLIYPTRRLDESMLKPEKWDISDDDIEIFDMSSSDLYKYGRIPIIIDDLDKYEEELKHCAKNSRDANNNLYHKNYKQGLIRDIVKIYNQKLYKYIISDKVECKQITRPDTDNSYKKHISDSINKYNFNQPFIIDLKPEERQKNNWQCYIDSRESRLIFLVWCLDENLYENDENEFSRVPYIIDDVPKTDIIFDNNTEKNDKDKYIRDLLKERNKKLFKFIDTEGTEDLGCVAPTQEKKYEIYVSESIKAKNSDKKYIIPNIIINKRHINNWICVIDIRNYKLIFLVWSVRADLY
uniref:Uncharacterized protein n=1 Tax=viral metagenome TaxID=1070528 RepID=A0A6C0DYE8_9ZZZZ